MVIALNLIGSMLLAQDCARNLIEARQAYYNGEFVRVVSLLKCLPELDNEEDLADALELQVNANLLLGNKEDADAGMLHLLTEKPFYKPRTTDLVKYEQLFESYEIVKKFDFTFFLGSNSPQYHVLQYRSYSSITEEPEDYETSVGLLLGFGADLMITQNLYLSTGLTYQTSSYNYTEGIMDFQQVGVNEKFQHLSFPLLGGFQWKIGPFDAFVVGGGSLHFLLTARGDIELFGQNPEITTPLNGLARKITNQDLSGQKRVLIPSYTAGLGLRRNIGLYGVSLSLHYDFGLRNVIDADKRYTDVKLQQEYSYIADDFKVDYLQLKFGFTRHILYPKKR